MKANHALNRAQCRDLADKWLMLSRRSEGWLRLVQGMDEIRYGDQLPLAALRTSAPHHRALLHALTEGDTTTINRLNLIVITRRLTGE